jgi:hypothetical protein
MDEVHVLVHADEVEDVGGISAAIFLVADVANCFEESNVFLGGACAGPRVHREQHCLYLHRGVLHYQVVDLLDVLIPPLMFITSMTVI